MSGGGPGQRVCGCGEHRRVCVSRRRVRSGEELLWPHGLGVFGSGPPETGANRLGVDVGGEVRFSELFGEGKETLVIYSFMFPRWSGDTRPGPADGETARLPLAENPVPFLHIDP